MATEVKIGFAESPRELAVTTGEEAGALAERITTALREPEGVLELHDVRGARHLIRNSRIANVEIGAGPGRSVGFVGG